MTINLQAKTDFVKGDVGRVFGHTVVKRDGAGTGPDLVVALQDVKAGSSGWFERTAA